MFIIKSEKSCGALVYKEENGNIEFLVLKHVLGSHWSFPKGHVEDGESEKQTALREVYEETGLKINFVEGFRKKVTYSPKPGIMKDVVYFLGYTKNPDFKRQEEEISDIEWMDAKKGAQYLTYDNDKYLLASAIEKLKIAGIYKTAAEN